MKTKRFLSLFIAVVLCLSTFTTFAEEIVAEPLAYDEYVDYSDMSNWAYWSEGENTSADVFFVCPTVDMGKGGNLVADITNEKYKDKLDVLYTTILWILM